MEISCAFPPGPEVIDHIALAEELGYQRAWLYDSPALYPDVWVTLAQAAERTQRIAIGPAVLVPSLRHPLTTAAAISTLEQLAPGRLVVAVGTGFTARRMLGQKPLPWKQVERYLRQVRGLLRGDAVEVDGAMVQLCAPEGYGAKRPVETPIVVAANGPKGLAVARELGDGIMCVGSPQPGFEWCSLLQFGTVFDEGESFESPRVFDAIGPAIGVVYHGTYEAAPERVDSLPGGAEWRKAIEAIPADIRHIHVHEDHLIAVPEREKPLLSPALGGTTFSGTPDQVRARLADLESQGLTEILDAPMGSDVPRELRAMAAALGL